MHNIISSYFYPMIRAGVNLDKAIDTVYLNYQEVLRKKGIEDKEQLKQKMREYYSSQGINLDEYVKTISVDKFITLMMRMVIDTPNQEIKVQEPQAPQVTPEEKGFREKERKYQENLQLRMNLRANMLDFTREMVKHILPAERSVNDRDGWEEEHSDDLIDLFENVRQEFAEEAHHLGIEHGRFSEMMESCYQEIMAESF